MVCDQSRSSARSMGLRRGLAAASNAARRACVRCAWRTSFSTLWSAWKTRSSVWEDLARSRMRATTKCTRGCSSLGLEEAVVVVEEDEEAEEEAKWARLESSRERKTSRVDSW